MGDGARALRCMPGEVEPEALAVRGHERETIPNGPVDGPGLRALDRYQEMMGRFARTTAEKQLAEAERSIACLVRAEVDAIMSGAPPTEERPATMTWHAGSRFATTDNIWEASVLVGLPVVGKGETVFLAASLIFSMCIQLLIFVAMSKGFARLPAGGSTLDTQYDPVRFVCVLAVCVWVLSVIREVRSALTWAVSMWLLPRRPTRTVRSASMHMLVSISTMRLWFVATLVAIRLGITASLMRAGALRLAASRSPTELLLSAAALGFAIDTPRRVRAWGLSAQTHARGVMGCVRRMQQ